MERRATLALARFRGRHGHNSSDGASTCQASEAAKAPPTIPDHELIRPIGAGSYGEVWLARTATGSRRAVKIIYRQSFDHDRPFEREFEGIKKFEPISHARESQIDIFHVGRNDAAGLFYYTMELADDATAQSRLRIPGSASGGLGSRQVFPAEPAREQSGEDRYVPRTLKRELRTRGPLPLTESIQIGLALTRALEHLHAHGLVHRDIKPSNIIFVNGVPKLADIGLVTSVDATRSFVGTDGYIPPEGPGAPPADLYSLGKVLYECVTGKDRLEFPELPTDWHRQVEMSVVIEIDPGRQGVVVGARHLWSLGDLRESAIAVIDVKHVGAVLVIHEQVQIAVVVKITPNAPDEDLPKVIDNGPLRNLGERVRRRLCLRSSKNADEEHRKDEKRTLHMRF